jgi:undecaprenyl-diphosphatase
LVAALLTLSAVSGRASPGDLMIGHLLQALPGGRFLESVADLLALHPVTLAFWFAGALAAVHRRNTTLLLAGVLVLLALDLNPALKELVERGRPTSDQLTIREPAPGWGFPSGHAMRAILVFGYAGITVSMLVQGPWSRFFSATCAVAIALIGFDRVYDGAHWPSDVLAGFAFGAVVLWLCLWLSSIVIRYLTAFLRMFNAPMQQRDLR